MIPQIGSSISVLTNSDLHDILKEWLRCMIGSFDEKQWSRLNIMHRSTIKLLLECMFINLKYNLGGRNNGFNRGSKFK